MKNFYLRINKLNIKHHLATTVVDLLCARRGYPNYSSVVQEDLALHAFLRGLAPELLRQHVFETALQLPPIRQKLVGSRWRLSTIPPQGLLLTLGFGRGGPMSPPAGGGHLRLLRNWAANGRGRDSGAGTLRNV